MAECVSLGTEEALEKLRDQVTCAICLQPYRQPKVLHCFHVFCKECLQKLTVREEDKLIITCAICRKETDMSVTGKGVTDLPSAFHMNNLLEIESGLQHLKGIGKSETPDGMEELLPKRKGSLITCLHHSGEQINLFCETCTELICIKCTVHSHNGHQYDLIKDAFEKTKADLIRCMEPAQVNLNKINRAMSNYNNRGEQIETQLSGIESQIQSAFDQIQEVLDAKKKELVCQAQQLAQTKLASLKNEKSKMEALLSKLTGYIEKMQTTMETESKEIVLMTKEPTKINIQEVCSDTQCNDPEPSVKANMVLNIDLESTLQSLQALATVSTFKECPQMCYATGNGLSVSNMGTTKALLHVVDESNVPCKDDCTKHIQCKVESDITGSIIVGGGIRRRKDNQYEISYQPVAKGRHQLHITLHKQHIKGSPFSVMVKSPYTSLKKPFWSIRCIKQPCGLAVNENGELLVVSEQEDGVFVLNQNDEILRKFGTGSFMDIAVGEDHSIYVVDSSNHQVLHLTPEGYAIASTNKASKEPEGLNYPMGVAYNSKNKKVYVANTYNHNIQVLEADLADLALYKTFGGKGTGKSQFNYPWGITCDTSGRVLVADSENDRVQVFTPEGRFVRQFGKRGEKPGELKWPIGIATDSGSLVYVSEGGNHRVSIFAIDGQFLKCFGEGCGLRTPRGLTVDSNSGIVFLCDYESNCIQLH